ncbi:MAG: sulfatase [Pirellulales bacterium]|nr:sulfatase [Pirellulales bacterium]
MFAPKRTVKSPRPVVTPAVALLAVLVVQSAAGNPAPRRPNVLLLIADDMNCDLGCYGHTIAQTPHLDRLAARGVRFDRAYVQYTVCNPSRASFLTGLRPTTTGVWDNETQFRRNLPDVVTLPQLFRQHGYFTAGLGKVFHRGLSPDDVRPERDDPASWDHTFYGQATETGNRGEQRDMSGGRVRWCRWNAAAGTDQDQADGQLAAEAIRLLENRDERPFFLAVGFYRPHDPFQSPRAYFDRYALERLPLPPALAPDARMPELALPAGPMRQVFAEFTATDQREFLRAYYAGISFVDAQVGRLLAELDRQDLWDHTIVVLIGDHGYELGARGWWNKNTLFERSCRAPLIVWAPGAAGNGQSTQAITEFIDLYPTLADLCGIAGPAQLEGRSLRPVLDRPELPGKDFALTTIRRGPQVWGQSLRTREWRYTEWDQGRQGRELYGHDDDPGETRNVASEARFGDRVEALHQLLLSTAQPGDLAGAKSHETK